MPDMNKLILLILIMNQTTLALLDRGIAVHVVTDAVSSRSVHDRYTVDEAARKMTNF